MPSFRQVWAARAGTFPLRASLPQDLLAVDLDPEATRCVRLRFSGSQAVLVAADVLPAVDLGAPAPRPLALPKPLAARHAALCIPGRDAVIKLLNLPGSVTTHIEDQIREHLGIQDGAYRVGYRIISKSRAETRLLTVAVPNTQVIAACALFASGLPVPLAVEVAGLAVLTAFLKGPGQSLKDDTVGVIDIGSRTSYFAFFNKRDLILIRKFEFGYSTLLEQIERSMGVDRQTARDIVVDRSFDISQLVRDLADPFIKQLVISKHFVERRENCVVSRLFISDDPRGSHEWHKEIKAATGLEATPWHPFESVVAPADPVPAGAGAFHAPWAAALGAAWGAYESRQTRAPGENPS